MIVSAFFIVAASTSGRSPASARAASALVTTVAGSGNYFRVSALRNYLPADNNIIQGNLSFTYCICYLQFIDYNHVAQFDPGRGNNDLSGCCRTAFRPVCAGETIYPYIGTYTV